MGYLSHPSYAAWKFNKRRIKEIVDNLVPNLPAAAAALNADCLIVHGTSGTWLAGLLVVLQDLPVVLVRKARENSHGYNVEGNGNVNVSRGIVVDDSVCTGDTIRRIADTLEEHQAGLEVVGVATYLDYGSGDVKVHDTYVPIRFNGVDFPITKAQIPPVWTDDPYLPSIDMRSVSWPEMARASEVLDRMAQRLATL